MQRKKTVMSTTILLICDLVVGYLLLFVSKFVRYPFVSLGWAKHNHINVYNYTWIPFVILISFFVHKLCTKRYTFWDETKQIVKSIFHTLLISVLIIFLKKNFDTPRSYILIYFILAIFIFPVYRYNLKVFLSKLGIFCKNLIIIGAGNAGRDVALGMLREKETGYNIIGFLDDNKEGEEVVVNGQTFKVLGKVSDYKKIVPHSNVDAVVLAIPSLSKERLAELAAEIQKIVTVLYIVPEMRGVALYNTELYHLFMEQLFLFKINNNLNLMRNKLLKRFFDIVLCVISLPILLPVVFVLYILIRLDSPGNPFFIQERLGENGKTFRCIKFRSMYVKADEMLDEYFEKNPGAKEDWIKYKKIRGDDPRVTKMGKFLRKWSLDELPQVWNVLRGDMSLVGPRPYLPREEMDMKDYKDYILFTKPGITGLWQVTGRNKLLFKDRLKLDTWYVLNWSLWLDIVILFKTVKVVLKREGAY
ncbi:undecaprenyl-phosphate galactose phosphotransferase WbaP [Desulfothermus okinawensis]